jgi:hypothetical protein
MSDNPTQPFPAPEGDPTPSYWNAPPPSGPALPAPPASKKKMGKGKKWAIGAGAAVVLFAVIGATNHPATTPTAQPLAAASPSSSPDALPAVDPSVQAQLDADAAAKAAADKAAADKAAADAAAAKKAADAKAAAEKAAAAKAAADKAAAAKAAAAAVTDKSTYTKISTRQFAKVAKNPDSYIGKKYMLYGHVTQFDAATGTETFRADLASSRKSDWYEYDTNSIVDQGRDGLFDDVVQDDLVTLYVEVNGSYSYDTQIGGNTTVPRFTANIVKVTGSSS